MPRVIFLIEFFPDDLPDQRRSPDTRFQSIGHRPAIQDVAKPFPLPGLELTGTSTTVAFPQTCLAVLIPVLNPHRDSATVNLQALGNLTGAIPIQAQENPLNAQHYSRRLVLLSLPPQLQKLLNGPPIPFGKYVHICPATIDL